MYVISWDILLQFYKIDLDINYASFELKYMLLIEKWCKVIWMTETKFVFNMREIQTGKFYHYDIENDEKLYDIYKHLYNIT